MILLLRTGVEPGWRYIQKATSWDSYENVFEKIKSAVIPREERSFLIFEGRSGRVTLNTIGQIKAILVALAEGMPIALELDPEDDGHQEYTLTTLGEYPLFRMNFPALDFEAPRTQYVLQRGGYTLRAKDVFPVLRKAVVTLDGQTLLRTEPHTLRPTRGGIDGEYHETLSGWFALFDPHYDTVRDIISRACMNTLVRVHDSGNVGQLVYEQVEVHAPLGVCVACESLEKLAILGEHGAGGIMAVLSELTWENYEQLHDAARGYIARVIEVTEADLPMALSYRDYSEESRPVRWAVVEATDSTNNLLHVRYNAQPNEDQINSIAVLQDTLGGYELFRSADAPMDEMCWDSHLQIWRKSVTLACVLCGEYECEHLVPEVRTRPQEASRITQPETTLLEEFLEDRQMRARYIGSTEITFTEESIETSARWMLTQQLQRLGLSWNTVRTMCTDSMRETLRRELARRFAAEAIPEPKNTWPWLLTQIKHFEAGKPIRPEGTNPRASYWLRTIGRYTVGDKMSGVLTSTEKVQTVIRSTLQNITQLGLRPQEVFGRQGLGYLSAAPKRGWGIIPLEMLEKMAWFMRLDRHLPADYDNYEDSMKQVLVIRLLQGHQYGNIDRRGIKDWAWMDLRPDYEEWREELGLWLAKRMWTTPGIFVDLQDSPGFSTRKTVSQYGEEMILLLRQGKLNMNMDGFRNLLQEHAGFSDLRAYRTQIVARGGLFGKYLDRARIRTLNYKDRILDDISHIGTYKRRLATIIGQHLLKYQRLVWEMNTYLPPATPTQSVGVTPVIFEKSAFEEIPMMFGLLLLYDDLFQRAVAASTLLKRRLNQIHSKVGITGSGIAPLEKWPPLDQPNPEQSQFLPHLMRAIATVSSFVDLKERLGWDENVPDGLLPRLILNNPSVMTTTEIGIQVLETAFGTMGGDRLEEARSIQGDAARLVQLVQSLGSLVIRRDVPEDHEPDLMEKLLMGELNVYDAGLLDDL